MVTLSLFQGAQRLKNILIVRATSNSGDDDGFAKLREAVLAEPSVGKLIPDVLMTCRSLDEFWGFIKTEYDTYHERRRYLQEQFEPPLQELERRQLGSPSTLSADALDSCDSQHVREAWTTALSRLKNDPDGAVTAARTVLEAVCKHILDEAGIEYTDREDLPKLHSMALDQLELSPNQQVDETVRAMLGSAQQVVNRISALRNQVSDAHGKGKQSPELGPHDDELAVNMAGAIASHMISTWETQHA